jgi:hypothetical protein
MGGLKVRAQSLKALTSRDMTCDKQILQPPESLKWIGSKIKRSMGAVSPRRCSASRAGVFPGEI